MLYYIYNNNHFVCFTLTQHSKSVTTQMKNRKIKKNNDLCVHQTVSQADLAALELLKSTGFSVLDAAQLACAVARNARGNVLRGMQMVAAGVKMLELQENTVDFGSAAWASVEARASRRPTTTRDLRHYVRRMIRVDGFARLPLRAMTTAQCRSMLQAAFGHSAHSYRKARAILHSIFAYGIRREWCDTNPVSRIEAPTVVEKTISPLTQKEVGQLRATVAKPGFADMRFSLSLLLYSGVRPAEVQRLSPEDVCWNEQMVLIRPQKSKTGGGRAVPLRLLPGLRRQDCTVPRNWLSRWRALRRRAGFTRWNPDVCRHTFATYHAAYFRNLPELQLEMGHRDLNLLRSRYMMPASRKAAKVYFDFIRKE